MVTRTQYVEVGQRFGRLAVKDPDAVINWPSGAGRAAVCLCECGIERTIGLRQLLSGRTKSCGCLKHEAGVASLKGGPKGAQRTLFTSVGQRFGNGVVLDPEIKIMQGTRATRGARLCCDCGTEYETPLKKLYSQSSPVKSCGCLGKRRNNLSHTPIYRTWRNMLSRCENPNNARYHNYGGRGIEVCERWHDFFLFAADIERLLGPRPLRQTLDRKNVHGNYEENNVRWRDQYHQVHNRQCSHPQGVSFLEGRRKEVSRLWQLGLDSVQIALDLDVGLPAIRRDISWIAARAYLLEDIRRQAASD